MMVNIEMSKEINREPIHQVSALAKWGMFAQHVERRKFGGMACHNHLCCNFISQLVKWKCTPNSLQALTSPYRWCEEWRAWQEAHGMPGFPGVLSAGHSSMKDGNGESRHSGSVGSSTSMRPIPTSSNLSYWLNSEPPLCPEHRPQPFFRTFIPAFEHATGTHPCACISPLVRMLSSLLFAYASFLQPSRHTWDGASPKAFKTC